MNKYLLSIAFAFVLLLQFSTDTLAQNSKTKIYNPEADASAEVAAAVEKARANGKHVLLQVGGNWCSWCIRFHQLTTSKAKLDSALHANFVVVKVNHSKENRNLELLEKLDYPQRFGFPVFVVLNGNGERIHTQNSAYLEEGSGYSNKKILEFFNQWSPGALDAERYKK